MKWLSALKVLGPVILSLVPGGAVLAPLIIAGIQLAEESGQSGATKKIIAKEAVKTGAIAANTIAKREVINVVKAEQVADDTIDAIVGAVNLVSKAKEKK